MLDPQHPIAKLLREDRRYAFDAYVFVFEALRFAQEKLGMGQQVPADEAARAKRAQSASRHLTGQELCEAIRQYGWQQFGYMTKAVFNHWGIRSTGDFGEVVFNLIRIGEMHKTDGDRREDFENVYDFDSLVGAFPFAVPQDE